MSLTLRFFRGWLPLAVAITIGCAGLYGVVQQVYRTSANQPQIGMAEDGAHDLLRGVTATDVVSLEGSRVVDVATSVSPFVVVYDATGTPAASNARLDGKMPIPPQGVLQNSIGKSGGNRITWQPRPGVRIATVIESAGDKGFVLAGRSLRESEAATDDITKLIAAGWAVAMLATLLTVLIVQLIGGDGTGRRRRNSGDLSVR